MSHDPATHRSASGASPFADPERRSVCVFSHPNHELAVFGLLQRLTPHMVFLTDGGGARRVDETRRGLAHLGLSDRASFLGHPEEDLYRALLGADLPFYRALAAEVAERIDAIDPELVFCDAVEQYNPVHDIALPVTMTALRGCPRVLYEVPLVYQRSGADERYRIQRWPEAADGRRHRLVLNAPELAAKRHARATIYRELVDQLGPVITSLADDTLATEEVATSTLDPCRRDPSRQLRYEWRAERLRSDGAIERVITRDGHVWPLVEALLSG